ncbi:hypothetical protein DB30_00854 [Enhygromyxa salina]|uniref:Uncharacterized protein n=1 Tax=Enhygromyxa salina TaxID=215803 RepID=A0A0C2CTM2_9BACT|nr:hypothetical protein DB30_00854 [Enhygromyxa salina]
MIDNSGTMGEEQLALGPALSQLLDQLHGLTDKDGAPVHADVNIMVTSTDVGHPLCEPFAPDGYVPLAGAPQQTPCIDRLEDFTGLGADPLMFQQACTDICPFPVGPANDPYIHFEGPQGSTTNIPGNEVEAALHCLAPQGINGCGYESPLEAMLQAINPEASWNQGNSPFLRDGAMLAVVVMTDEADCSVLPPEGYALFVDQDTYWEVNPDTNTKTQATSAVCWNAGVDCGMPDMDGTFPDCVSLDTGALHPVNRYRAYLEDELIEHQNKNVVMLGIVGVPPVTAHNPRPPFEPTAGGVADLLYREWKDGPYPSGDMLPGDLDPAHKQFQFGIGPGCTSEDGMGGFRGQAIPPVRLREVCEGLDEPDRVRCCLESICDNDYSAAFTCLGGMIQWSIDPS